MSRPVKAEVWVDFDVVGPKRIFEGEITATDSKERLQLMLYDLAAAFNKPIGWGNFRQFRILFIRGD